MRSIAGKRLCRPLGVEPQQIAARVRDDELPGDDPSRSDVGPSSCRAEDVDGVVPFLDRLDRLASDRGDSENTASTSRHGITKLTPRPKGRSSDAVRRRSPGPAAHCRIRSTQLSRVRYANLRSGRSRGRTHRAQRPSGTCGRSPDHHASARIRKVPLITLDRSIGISTPLNIAGDELGVRGSVRRPDGVDVSGRPAIRATSTPNAVCRSEIARGRKRSTRCAPLDHAIVPAFADGCVSGSVALLANHRERGFCIPTAIVVNLMRER